MIENDWKPTWKKVKSKFHEGKRVEAYETKEQQGRLFREQEEKCSWRSDFGPICFEGKKDQIYQTVPPIMISHVPSTLQSSCGGEKSQKQSDISVTRALKFIKFCCDECGEAEEDVFSFPNMIDYMLGSPQLLTNFISTVSTKYGALASRGVWRT